jgi:hypothetical protein
VVGNNGKWDYSNTISIANQLPGDSFIFPSFISNDVLSCFITGNYEVLQLFSMNGSMVFKKDIRGLAGKIDIPVPTLSGFYFVRLSRGTDRKTQRVFIQ